MQQNNEWIPISDPRFRDNKTVTSKTWLLFDDGTVIRYGCDDWPFAEVTHFKND